MTLGSLLDESLEKLEALKIIDAEETEEESNAGSEEGLVKGTSVNEESHVPTNETQMGGVDAPLTTARSLHQLGNRGMPYFEEMVEHSRLGRLRRRQGGHASADGSSRVQWEVVEMGDWNDADPEPMEGVGSAETSGNGTKRQRLS